MKSAWLTQVNADRAANGAAPLVFDEALLESARYWANFMGTTGYFNHCIPASSCGGGSATPPPGAAPQDATPATRDAYFNAYFGGWGENIAAGFGNWQGAESAFMAEKANCPGDTAVGCPFSESTGHFLNIVDPSYLWIGLGEATGGASPYAVLRPRICDTGARPVVVEFATERAHGAPPRAEALKGRAPRP